MKIVYISGSPRDKSNTDYLLNACSSILEGELIKLSMYKVEFCKSCWLCLKNKKCIINDDISNIIIPKILEADVIFLGSPVYFNNVSAQLKTFIDRTWCIRGKLRNKIGAALVVGRRYGHQSAINAMNSFFLKHEMIVANRGVSGMAFQKDKIKDDKESINAVKQLCNRILELDKVKRGEKNVNRMVSDN